MTELQSINDAEKLDATRFIEHPAAVTFWASNFGQECFDVDWPRFKKAFLLENKNNLPGDNIADSEKLLKTSLDKECNSRVYVYDYNDFTRDHGLIGSILRLLNPEDYALPQSIGTKQDIISRTIYAQGANLTEANDRSPLRNILDMLGKVYKCIPLGDGVVIEFLPEHNLELLRASEEDLKAAGYPSVRQVKIGNRVIKLSFGNMTVDEIFENQKIKIAQMKSNLTDEQKAAKLTLEFKAIQEAKKQAEKEYNEKISNRSKKKRRRNSV